MQTFVFNKGAIVEVRRGRFPMAEDLLGRVGLIVETDEYRPGYYGVVLEGESEVRHFAEDELELAPRRS